MKYERICRLRRILTCVLILFVLLFFDQLTKLIAQFCLSGRPQPIPIIRGWIEFTYVLNDAIAFSMGSGNRPFMIAIMVLTPVFTAGFIVLALTLFKKNFPVQITLFVIASGAVGNFLDRLFVENEAGAPVVRDFIYLKFFNVCNFADFCITLGAVALIFVLAFIGPSAAFPLKKSWREQAKEREKE